MFVLTGFVPTKLAALAGLFLLDHLVLARSPSLPFPCWRVVFLLNVLSYRCVDYDTCEHVFYDFGADKKEELIGMDPEDQTQLLQALTDKGLTPIFVNRVQRGLLDLQPGEKAEGKQPGDGITNANIVIEMDITNDDDTVTTNMRSNATTTTATTTAMKTNIIDVGERMTINIDMETDTTNDDDITTTTVRSNTTTTTEGNTEIHTNTTEMNTDVHTNAIADASGNTSIFTDSDHHTDTDTIAVASGNTNTTIETGHHTDTDTVAVASGNTITDTDNHTHHDTKRSYVQSSLLLDEACTFLPCPFLSLLLPTVPPLPPPCPFPLTTPSPVPPILYTSLSLFLSLSLSLSPAPPLSPITHTVPSSSPLILCT
jgi:hypothetical protein